MVVAFTTDGPSPIEKIKGTGKEVARFIAKNGFQGIVIIHSRHVEGASAMKKYLSNARLAPFGSFEINAETNF